jgi:Mg-chelatase subunit ChlD
MTTDFERLRRWRLILGGGDADGICGGGGGSGSGQGEGAGAGDGSGGAGGGYPGLTGDDIDMDKALEELYDAQRSGGLGGSAPKVARWLGDIRKFFPSSVVRVIQQDAIERLNLKQLLLEPEMMNAVEPDVDMVTTLLALNQVMPSESRETARQVVRIVVEQLMKKLENPMREAISGSLNKAIRNRRPKHNEIDWDKTIRANLKHYQPDYKTVIPETRIGYGRRQSALREIVLCVDESGSMAASVVYAGVFGAVLASLPAVKTHMIVFDTNVVDLTEELQDPVDLLFGTQLGGGTDINRALTYCEEKITRPDETILVLISDLFEGGNRQQMLKRVGDLVASGVQFITLLALSDNGAPAYDHSVAAAMAEMGVPAFACTPDKFPDLMAAAINKRDIGQWAAQNEIVTTRSRQN